MTTRKARERGYSPAFELSIILARLLLKRFKCNVSVTPELLIKTLETPPQAKKHRRERLLILQGAYRIGNVESLLCYKDISVLVLVDDILTTGATTTQIAEKMRSNTVLKQVLGTVPLLRLTFARA